MWLYREKPVNALFVLANGGEIFPSIVSKKAGIYYGYTIKLIKKMEAHGLVTFEKKDRRNILNITEKGKQLAGKFKLLLGGLR